MAGKYLRRGVHRYQTTMGGKLSSSRTSQYEIFMLDSAASDTRHVMLPVPTQVCF
jgi:hypothetical protein